MMFADGSLRTFKKSENEDEFYRYLITFGSVGVITQMKMDL